MAERNLSMQPDVKTGLAVGLALVGLVGMMFFRRDPPLREEPLAEIENIAEMDQEIASTTRSPYPNLIDDVSDQTPAKTAGGPIPHRVQKGPFDAEAALDEAAEQVTNAERVAPALAAERDRAQPAAVAEPDPLRPPGAKPNHAEPAPSHNRDWQPIPRKPSVAGATTAGGAPADTAGRGKARTHTIQSGETLSSIAEQHYGASKYYRQIYEANRDRLRSINDVPEGVTLVLPEIAGGAPRANPPTNDLPPGFEPPRTRTSLSDEDSGEDPLRPTKARKSEESQPFKLSFEPVRPRTRAGETSTTGPGKGRGPKVEPALQIEELEFEPDEDEEEEPPLSGRGRRR
jgi:LysM repeat protein